MRPRCVLPLTGLVVLVLSGCRGPGRAPGDLAGQGRAALEPSEDAPSGLLRPDQIDRILRESPRSYRVASAAPVQGVALSDILGKTAASRSGRMDPFLELTWREGKPQLRSHLPDDVLEPLFGRANEAFAARDYETARELYVKAIAARPRYFKSYTYLGNALYFLSRYVEAEAVFRTAIELNPFDYQAHLFLGDTLHQLGHYRQAKLALLEAFTLNRQNAVVNERLRSTLAKLHLTVRRERLMPQVRIEHSGKEEVVIHLDHESGDRWYPLAACLACWAYEDACRRRSLPQEDTLKLIMYRECLLNQVASLAVRRHQGVLLAATDRALLEAVEDGFLDAIIFWEVVAPRAPSIMLLLPESLRQDITRYIDRYVLVSTQVVRRAQTLGDFFAQGSLREPDGSFTTARLPRVPGGSRLRIR